ncbi:reductase [Longimycelium tulufanense]|uniref:Reductase n=2 Tax=Longimycelium tulufanense TaxID=907463 RepID=A0A8J3CCQ5_9PSEU|nr:reductase [Longimycelium tulufanense]
MLSKAVAAEVVGRGHDVVCAARGTSGLVPGGARLVRIDRNEPDAYAPLSGGWFDAVVDVAWMSYRWVTEALRALGDNAGHWTFVSSMNVYADKNTCGQGIDAPLVEPVRGEGDPGQQDPPDRYGGVKVASEMAVREAVGDRAFVLRSGLIVGPDDPTDRFGYWPARLSRGGRVVVPDVPDQLTQYVDVRDLASWVVDAAESRLVGTFDGACAPLPLGKLLGGVAAVVAPPGTELVPVAPKVLTEMGVSPWAGPNSLPLWLPAGCAGFTAHDVAPSLAAGLRIRPLADTVRAALADERRRGLDRPGVAGLTPTKENEVLSGLDGEPIFAPNG